MPRATPRAEKTPIVGPSLYEDETAAALANANTSIAWSLLAVVTPLVLVIAWLMPTLAVFSLKVLAAIDMVAVATILITRRGHPRLGAAFLGMASWLTFTAATWFTGGLTSATVVGLFLVVVFTSISVGWKGGVGASLLGVATVLAMALAESRGMLPRDAMSYTPWIQAAAYSIFFVGLGVLQANVSASVKRSRDRASRESVQRRAAEKRLLDVVDNAPFGAIVCTLGRGGDLRVAQVNVSASEMLGERAEGLVGKPIEKAFSALSTDSVLTALERVATDGGRFHAESVPFYANSKSGTLELHAFQIGVNSVAVFFSDITERRRKQVQIQRMAFHDELTKLPNRKLLLDRLGVALASAQRRSTEVALFFIDLDNFKPINDAHGHTLGDELLVAVAKRLAGCARASDTVARFGGDEFTVLMPDVASREQVEAVARKLVEALGEPFVLGTQSLTVTASIGVSITTPEDRSPSALLERADIAMYQVKRAGRNGYRIHQGGITTS